MRTLGEKREEKRLTTHGARWLVAMKAALSERSRAFQQRDRSATRGERKDVSDGLEGIETVNQQLLAKVLADLEGANIVELPRQTKFVAVGHVVKVRISRGRDDRTRQFMVDGYSMDIDPVIEVAEAYVSPLMQVIMKCEVGDKVQYEAPAGLTGIMILEIRLPNDKELAALDPQNVCKKIAA